MLWTLLGIAAIVLSLIYPAIAVVLVVAFIVYNVIRLISAFKEGTAVSGCIINGACIAIGIAVLIWSFT